MLSLKRFKKILLWFFLSLLFLLIALWIFIQTPFGQNFIIKKITQRLSKDLQTTVTIQHVDFSLFNKMHLEGVFIADHQQDTLLYAGDIKIRLTDWFFLKKSIELKYIGLEDAVIKFQRTDSVWSQQFLFDYLSSPADNNKKSSINLNLKELSLKNVSFLQRDGWLGADMNIKVGALDLNADKIDFTTKIVDASTLEISNPQVIINNYQGRFTGTEQARVKTLPGDSSLPLLQWNQDDWAVRLNKLTITNGIFRDDKQSPEPILPYFDGRHLDFTAINAEFTNVQMRQDTVTAHLELQTKERSGLVVKKMLADARATPQLMAFSKMDIHTNNSVIRDFFMMSYDDFDDMDDFIHKVKMSANFDNAQIESDDIGLFAPELKNWKKKILLKGKARGTVDAMVGKDMVIQAGNNTLLNGDISLTGLPDINQTFIDFKANDFKTTYGDAVTIVPALRNITSPDLRKFKYVYFKGSFTGFIRDFVTFGNIQTNLGTIKSDLNMKLPVGRAPVYSGTLATDNFNLGELLDNSSIGSISMSGNFNGNGFDENNRSALVDAKVNFIDYNDYRYHDITVKGKLDKKLFDGVAAINDQNATMTLNGLINFNDKVPSFDFFADVQKANLKALNLTADSIAFKAKFNLNFTGDNIDNFIGSAKVTGAELTRNGDRLPFDSLILYSSLVGNKKTLSAHSNEFTGEISGVFNIGDLPNAFQLFLNKYYPAYIKPPTRIPSNEAFHFDITTHFVEPYIRLVDSSFYGFNDTHLYGDLNLDSNLLNVHASIPQFKYKQYNFDDVNVVGRGTLNNLFLSGDAKNININDSLHIPEAVFTINAHNDSSRLSLVTSASQAVNKANLNALVLTYSNGVKIELDNSSFVVNGKTWTIDNKGVLEFRGNEPTSGQLVLREGEQRIMIKTQPSTNGNWNDLKIELTKVNIGDFSPYVLPHNRLEGLVSGNLMVQDPTHNLKIISDDIQTSFLRLDNDSIGEIRTSLNYDNTNKELKAKGNTLNQENYLGFNADIFLGDSLKAKNNVIALQARNFQIKMLERFLSDLFSDIQGYLTGDININGGFDDLNITGKGRLKDAGLRVNFTQVYYKIQDTDVQLSPTEINLGGLVLIDTVTHNPLYVVNGSIQHESFKNMYYNILISTQKPGSSPGFNNRPVLLLNTTSRDNSQFSGRVKGTASLSLEGPQSDMAMKISATASEKDSSSIVITSSNSRESGIADFLVERKYGQEMTSMITDQNASRITYDVEVTADTMVNVRVVLDELTGDEIKGKGSGTLNIHSGSNEPMSIRGRYDIDEGNYLFTFQSFFKKPFELRRESGNYIQWDGDPMQARINLNAIYKADRVNFAPLAQQLDPDLAKARGDVYVIATLTDQLFKPNIKFALDFPPNSPAVTDPGLALVIQQLQKNQDEMNKQVTYLIVFNSFAPYGDNSNYTTAGLGINTISGIFLNVISDQVNKILGKLLKNDKYQININTTLYNRNIIDQNNKLDLASNVNFSIGRSFFNDRFVITAGGGLDAPLQQSTIQQSIQLLPDVTMEWLINRSGSLRASFFYHENTDYLTTTASGGPGRARRYGAGVTYRRDFNKFGDIFKSRSKRNRLPKPPAPKEEVPPAVIVPKQE